MMKELAIAEKIILRKILGPIKGRDQYRRRHNNELYKHIEKITDTIRKRRIAIYGHLQRMNSNKLTGRIFKYIKKLKMANIWFSETDSDIEELQITQEDITERIPLRSKFHNFKGFQENPIRKTGAVWTGERR